MFINSDKSSSGDGVIPRKGSEEAVVNAKRGGEAPRRPSPFIEIRGDDVEDDTDILLSRSSPSGVTPLEFVLDADAEEEG
jgi:hypothetical protein